LEWVEQGLNELEGTGTPAEGRLWLGKGSVLMFISEDLPAARQALTQALTCLPKDASELRIRSLSNLGIISCLEGDVKAGTDFYAQALDLCEQTGNDLDKAVIATNLTIEFWIAGDWPAALAEAHKALTLTEALGDIEGQATLALNMGIIYTNQGDLDAARASLTRSVELLRRYSLIRYLIDALASLANVHIRSEEWDEAAACLTSAEQYIEELDAPCALSEIQRGWAYIALARGQVEQAHTAAQQAVEYSKDQDAREQGMSLAVLGTCQAAMGHDEQAIQTLQQSLEVLEDSYPYETARSQLDLARVLLRARQDVRTSTDLQPDTLLEQARALFEHLGAQLDLAMAHQVQQQERILV
jgi:tetratricopeptide (TPR) repeat protein